MNKYDFEKEFEIRNPRCTHILKHLRLALGVKKVRWEHITKLNMELFVNYLTDNLSQNSTHTYFAVIKAFLARFNEEGIIPCPNPKIRIKTEPSQHIALTMDELLRFDAYTPATRNEALAKNIFMRGCLTGARFSDAIKFTEDNIRDGVLSYVSKKTKTETNVPAHALLSKYIQSTELPMPNIGTLNINIRNICRKIGMLDDVQLFTRGKLRKGPKCDFVSEHTSRRTFCTILALLNVPTETIAKLAGHSNSTITSSRYITIDTANLNDGALRFFSAQ